MGAIPVEVGLYTHLSDIPVKYNLNCKIKQNYVYLSN